MKSNDDLSLADILKGFNKRHFRYLLIGGHAVSQYGFARITKDYDFWIDPKYRDEAIQVLVEEYQFDPPADEDLKKPIVVLYSDWQKIDLFLARRFSNAEGRVLDFDQCYEHSTTIKDSAEDFWITLPSVDDLIALKKMRPKLKAADREDIAFLESLQKD